MRKVNIAFEEDVEMAPPRPGRRANDDTQPSPPILDPPGLNIFKTNVI